MTVYVDAVFLLNTLINGMLLHTTARIRGAPMHRARFWLAASAGGIYAVLCCLPALQFLQLWPMKLLAMVLMLLLSFGAHRHTVTDGVVFLLLSVGLCGLVYFVVTVLCGTQIPAGGVYPVTFPELLLTTGLAAFCGRLVGTRAAVQAGERLFPIRLRLGDAVIPLTALYDTGNSLRDPSSGEPVTVVSADALVQAVGKEPLRAIRRGDLKTALELLAPYRPRLIPYRAVGVSGGLLIALRCKELRVGTHLQQNPLIALSPTPVCDSGRYAALVGGNLYEQQSTDQNHKLSSAALRRKNHVHQRKRCAAAAAEKHRGAGNPASDGGR